MGVYPFMFASVKDFEPVVERLVQVRSHSMTCMLGLALIHHMTGGTKANI
jgi:hypothetical protein